MKWTAEPARAEDVPTALAQALAVARTSPCGPTFVSVPVDDWTKPCAAVAPRKVAGRTLPERAALDGMAPALTVARRLAMVVRPEVDAEDAWSGAVARAERLRALVYASPVNFRAMAAGQCGSRAPGASPPRSRRRCGWTARG